MKTIRIFTALVAVTMLLAACGGTQTGAEKVLNLYAWSEYIPQALLDGFEEETGITVNYDTYSSNEELLAKLQAGASGYDVIIPSDYAITIMITQDLLEEIDLTRIPNFANIAEALKDPYFDPGNKYSVPYQWGTSALAIDTEKVTTEITSWDELWNPEYEQLIVMLDDSREVLGMVLLTLGYDKNSTDPDELEEAKQKLTELMPNIRLFDSDSPKTALLTGEVWMGMVWNGEAAIAHVDNPAIEYVCPLEGCTIWYDNLAIPKSAPHVDNAHLFIDYVLRPEVSILITQEFPYSNPNQAALELMETEDPELYAAYMNYTATNPPEDWFDRMHPVLDVGDATELWDRIWTEVKGGE